MYRPSSLGHKLATKIRIITETKKLWEINLPFLSHIVKNKYLCSRIWHLKMKKILFICLGNICRSPAADGIMKHLVAERGLEDEFLIDSAGIGSWHVGQLSDYRMRQCGQRHGYNFDHRARQFSSMDFDRFDFIAVMDQENYHDVARQANSQADLAKIIRMSDYLRHHPGQKTVPDPYYGSTRDFEFALELLEDACQGLLDELTK